MPLVPWNVSSAEPELDDGTAQTTVQLSNASAYRPLSAFLPITNTLEYDTSFAVCSFPFANSAELVQKIGFMVMVSVSVRVRVTCCRGASASSFKDVLNANRGRLANTPTH